ncbi:MBL fold metallo-hydrolase [Terriglobus sp. ADX1]|uniref:MBL fold metallo-hydrolase n=1 Tax=Terriglobus sp. ADX1 TaxID=2794063 RepID=UPI002FE62188
MPDEAERSHTLTSAERMTNIRKVEIGPESLGVWFLGQNGFLLKTSDGTRIAIDPYLTNSCGEKYASSQFDLSRVIPPPLEPEDLDVDVVLITHSHEDHLDEATLRRLRCRPWIVGPFQAMQRVREWGISEQKQLLLHPSESLSLFGINIEGTFALPTDNTDLNHIGLKCTFDNGITFYNTGDTAYAQLLEDLFPKDVDICAICINGGFHNLSSSDAAQLIKVIRPNLVIPTHYDLMACNRSDPENFRIALLHEGCTATYCRLGYDEPLIYARGQL